MRARTFVVALDVAAKPLDEGHGGRYRHLCQHSGFDYGLAGIARA